MAESDCPTLGCKYPIHGDAKVKLDNHELDLSVEYYHCVETKFPALAANSINTDRAYVFCFNFICLICFYFHVVDLMFFKVEDSKGLRCVSFMACC